VARVRDLCARAGRPYEPAFLLDALSEERAQGITIDAARAHLRTPTREFLFVDAPGHVDLVKNMVSGASHADAALLVVDAADGARENSRRHGALLALLGAGPIVLVVSKMDLVGYDEGAWRAVVAQCEAFLREAGAPAALAVPVSAIDGVNLTARATRMPWYEGPTLLEALERLPEPTDAADAPLRLPVQDVYKFGIGGGDRRILVGTVESGRLAAGDAVEFFPSRKRSRVRAIESFGRPAPAEARAGAACGLTLEEQVFVTRGEVLARVGEAPPSVSDRLRATVLWLGREPLETGQDLHLKIGTAKVACRVERIERVLDSATLAERPLADRAERNDLADCVLRCRRPIAFDPADRVAATGRFALLDGTVVRGAGVVREALPDAQELIRERVTARDRKWEQSLVTPEERARRHGQRPALVLVTGAPESPRKEVAKALEARLFAEGRLVYYLGFGSVLHGLDADLEGTRGGLHPAELMRRLGEVAHILLDAGLLLVVTAQELRDEDVAVLRTVVGDAAVEVAWVGDEVTTDLEPSLRVRPGPETDAVVEIVAHLTRRGLLRGDGDLAP
jgi:bifunctional enzyme CysN/CysC